MENAKTDYIPRVAFTPQEAAESMGVSMPTLYGYIHRAADPLPAVRVGRQYRIPAKSMEDWLIRQTQNIII